MNITIDSILTSPVDLPDNGLASLGGSVAAKYKAVINFSFQKYTSTQKRLQFSGHVISNINRLDTDSFISTYNFLVGETIIIPMSAHNAGTLTITAVTDTSITVSASLVSEILEVGYIYVNKKITALDFYYNLIANSDSLSFLSKTDSDTLQKYAVSGIDATVSSPVYLQIGTKSFGWVTDIITAPTQSTSTIAGAGMTGYVSITGAYIQSFTITHYFYEAPFFTKEYFSNFASLVPVSDFVDSQLNGSPVNNGWQYVCQVNGKYTAGIVYENSGVSDKVPGNAAWFNQNNARTIPNFTLDTISYTISGQPAAQVDFGKDVVVTLKVKSASGGFANHTGGLGTLLVLTHFYCPLTDSTYKNTATTLLQNLMHDKAIIELGVAAINGINYGTNYQVLKTCSGTAVNAYNATLTFTISYATYLKNILAAKSVADRNYSLSVFTGTTTDSIP